MSAFASMDFKTSGPSPIALETVNVEIDPTTMLDDYASQFVKETYRVDPLVAERVELTEEEMKAYARYLLAKRIECVNNACRDFRLLKTLYIPSFLQYAISMIGEVVVRDRGLKMMPTYENDDIIDFKKASEISSRIRMFEGKLQMVLDGMPRTITGDVDTMSCALIAGYARAQYKVEHASSAYVAAFLGFKLKEELAMKTLYRVQYDDLEYMRAAIINRLELY